MAKFIIWIVEDSGELTKAWVKYAVNEVFQNDRLRICTQVNKGLGYYPLECLKASVKHYNQMACRQLKYPCISENTRNIRNLCICSHVSQKILVIFVIFVYAL